MLQPKPFYGLGFLFVLDHKIVQDNRVIFYLYPSTIIRRHGTEN